MRHQFACQTAKMKVLISVLALALAVSAEVYDDFFESRRPTVNVKDITFTLYTRSHAGEGTLLQLGDKEGLKKSGFDSKLPVKIATHGYMTDACGDSVQGLRKAFHAKADCNFISIDWSKYAKFPLYEDSALCVGAIGVHISKFMKFIRDEAGLNIKDFHIMGHDVGAHIVSFVSDEFPKEKIGRITGFDPAGPIFENAPTKYRLDPADALFVDVVHTSTFYPGLRNPIGTVDFYPNGGNRQPGCDELDFVCHHNTSFRYYICSIKTGKDYETNKCDSLKDAESGNCKGEQAPMGVGANTAKPGIYYGKITKVPDC